MRQASELREVDTILESFPGPVTLTTSMRWKLTALAICLGFAAFCIFLLVTGSVSGWYDTVMAWLATAFFGACAIRALILLLAPVGASLTLDADGFAVTGIFSHARSSWRDVSGFRVETSDDAGKVPTITFDVRTDGAEPQRGGATKTTGTLPGSYGLSDDDLAWLMERWRARALAQQA